MMSPEDAAYVQGWRDALAKAVEIMERERPLGHSWAWDAIEKLKWAKNDHGRGRG